MTDDARRRLPPVHELARDDLIERFGRARVTEAARAVLADARAQAGGGDAPALGTLAQQLQARLQPQQLPAINATGVVLHTNLGRAPWSARAIAAASQAAGYCTVELDTHGQRGRRGAEVEERICALTGAEAAVLVNNGAAAVLLCLRELARDRQVLVSRGELVEIGGGFRVPDVMAESGAELTEVGTTNRTHLRDFERALSPDVAAILRVHHSNFRQVGFVAEASLRELCALGPPVVVDVGSGALFEIGDEPTVAAQLRDGATLVCFSGDKLLGGPQAGIIVGKAEVIDRMRKQPLLRALRPDKVTLAALGATVDDWLTGTTVPVRAMIEAPIEALRAAAQTWLEAMPAHVDAELLEVDGAIGGGSVPGQRWPSIALAIRTPNPMKLQAALLQQDPPVITRVHRDQLLLDPRTVAPLGQGDTLVGALLKALEHT